MLVTKAGSACYGLEVTYVYICIYIDTMALCLQMRKPTKVERHPIHWLNIRLTRPWCMQGGACTCSFTRIPFELLQANLLQTITISHRQETRALTFNLMKLGRNESRRQNLPEACPQPLKDVCRVFFVLDDVQTSCQIGTYHLLMSWGSTAK